MISKFVGQLFYYYYILLILRIFMSWIPNIDWDVQPSKFLRSITDPYLNIFRSVIPPLGMLDLSPIVAIILLMFMQGIVCRLLFSFGL